MKQLPSDKYNIAWFKLAEFVARGEKERALGIYRLLVYSFNDKALAAQLAGDLFLAFNDIQEASLRYYHAAELYVSDGKIIQAIAVFEHLITLDPAHHEYVRNIFRLNIQLGNRQRCIETFSLIMQDAITNNKYDEVLLFIEDSLPLESDLKVDIYIKMTILCIATTLAERYGLLYMKKAINLLAKKENTSELQHFLSTLEALNTYYYDQAYIYLLEESVII